MSRFFRGGSSDSESEESEEEEIQRPRPAAPSRVYQFSDDEDDTKRVVRSAKDKRFDILQGSIKIMRNSMKINDIAKIQAEYENLTRDYEKSKAVIAKEGIPNFFIKCLGDLETYIQQQWEDTDGRKKLSKLNAKALSSLRQKLRKYNKDFEEKIKEYKADPSKFEEVEEEEEDEADEDNDAVDEIDSKKEKVEKQSRPKAFDDEDEDSDDDFFATDSDESSSEDELPEGGRKQWILEMFLKDTTSKDDKKGGKRDRADKKPKPAAEKKVKEEGWTEVSKSSTKALFPKDTEINHQAVLKKFHEILAVRGKKGTDRSEQIEYFSELRKIANQHELGEAMDLKLTFTITAAIMDSTSGADAALKPTLWVKLLDTVKEIFNLLDSHPDVQFEAKEEENVEDKTKPYSLQEDPVTLMERVDSEFTKILQNCDGHSPEYITKLKDEVVIVQLIDQLMRMYESKKSDKIAHLCRIYLLRIEHTYYKLDVKDLREITKQIKENEDKKANSKEDSENSEEKQTEESKENESEKNKRDH